jgi:hypothetical protein
MSAADVLTVRLQLRKNGFDPIPVEGKVPAGKAWQTKFDTTTDEIRLWSKPGFWYLADNTGVLAKRTPGLDIDIVIPEAADAIEALAREFFEEHGDIHVRYGKPPKRLIPLRTDEPFEKLSRSFTAPDGTEQKIEFLGDGQQYVVDGVHPNTGKPYNWFGGDLKTINRKDLPYVRREVAERFLDATTDLLIRDFGFTRAAERPKRTRRKGNGRQFISDQLANEEDWRVVINAILRGEKLHDNICILAAKYIASGMSEAAAINTLRALMELSAAPKDERWQQRFDEIPRAVQTAIDKYAPEEEEPEEEEPQTTTSPPPGAGAQTQSGPQPGLGPQPGQQPGTPPPPPGTGPQPGGPQPGTPPPQPAAAVSGLGEWDAGDDVKPPPPRGWLLGNTFCRTFLSSLIGPGGAGKTALRYAQALSIATGRNLTGEHIFQRCRVLIVSLEDDDKELRRRIRAVRLHYKIPLSEVKGWLFLAAPGAKAGKLMGIKGSRAVPGKLGPNLEAVITTRKIDLVILDPFVKTHSIEENLNSAIDDVAQILTDLATKHDIAMDAPHHVRKGQMEPGDADAGRGASAYIDAARLVYTCLPMSEDDARVFGISQEDRRDYIRVDSGKPNIARRNRNAKWFRLVSVTLDNQTGQYPAGDEVQTVEPWSPPDMWTGTTSLGLNAVLTDIDRGLTDTNGNPTGQRYSDHNAAKDRAAWKVVQKHYPQKTKEQCRQIIAKWLETELLYPEDYDDPVERKQRKGLFVDDAKRPS